MQSRHTRQRIHVDAETALARLQEFLRKHRRQKESAKDCLRRLILTRHPDKMTQTWASEWPEPSEPSESSEVRKGTKTTTTVDTDINEVLARWKDYCALKQCGILCEPHSREDVAATEKATELPHVVRTESSSSFSTSSGSSEKNGLSQRGGRVLLLVVWWCLLTLYDFALAAAERMWVVGGAECEEGEKHQQWSSSPWEHPSSSFWSSRSSTSSRTATPPRRRSRD